MSAARSDPAPDATVVPGGCLAAVARLETVVDRVDPMLRDAVGLHLLTLHEVALEVDDGVRDMDLFMVMTTAATAVVTAVERVNRDLLDTGGGGPGVQPHEVFWRAVYAPERYGFDVDWRDAFARSGGHVPGADVVPAVAEHLDRIGGEAAERMGGFVAAVHNADPELAELLAVHLHVIERLSDLIAAHEQPPPTAWRRRDEAANTVVKLIHARRTANRSVDDKWAAVFDLVRAAWDDDFLWTPHDQAPPDEGDDMDGYRIEGSDG